MLKKTFHYAICSGLLGLIVCGPSSAAASYSAIYEVAWVSVLERDAPSVDEPIWITHAGSGELEVKIDGEVVAPVEEQEYYSRYQPPSNAPGTHTIEVTLYSEPGKIERQVEGDFTTISSAPEDDTDISLRRWRDLEDSPPPHCKGYFAHSDAGPEPLREAVVSSGHPFAYKVQVKGAVGPWRTIEGRIWPGDCAPQVFASTLDEKESDARIVVLDAFGNEYKVADRTAMFGDGGGCQSTKGAPLSLFGAAMMLIGFALGRRRFSDRCDAHH